MSTPRLSIRTLIVDDEALARQRLIRYLRQSGQAVIIDEADSGLRAVELIRSFHPDVIFLDIEMPGLNGLEVLQQFEERPFHVIFQTAYDQFAIRAFEEQACDYLLKPFTAERLHRALESALSRVAGEQRLKALESRLAARPDNKGAGHAHLTKLTVKQGTRLRVVAASDIHCFISRDHYTCAYFSDGRDVIEGICDLSLGKLSERLDPREFKQLHRNNIVRVAAIVALSRSRQGDVSAELANGMKLPVSRNNQREVKEIIKGLGI